MMKKNRKKIIIVSASVIFALVILFLAVFAVTAKEKNNITAEELTEILSDPSKVFGIYTLFEKQTGQFENFNLARIADIRKANDANFDGLKQTDTVLGIEALRARKKNERVVIYLYFADGSDTVEIYCKGDFVAKLK